MPRNSRERAATGLFLTLVLLSLSGLVHPWFEPVRADPRYRNALEIARAGRMAATEAYRAAGGEALLG